jgi:hypothetical protein
MRVLRDDRLLQEQRPVGLQQRGDATRVGEGEPAMDAIGLIRPDAFILTAVRPASTWALMWSRTSLGSSPPTQP